jgi:hypothetical protein
MGETHVSMKDILASYRDAARRRRLVAVGVIVDISGPYTEPLQVPEYGGVTPCNSTPRNPAGEGAYVEAVVWVPAEALSPTGDSGTPPATGGQAGNPSGRPLQPPQASKAPPASAYPSQPGGLQASQPAASQPGSVQGPASLPACLPGARCHRTTCGPCADALRSLHG